MTAETGYGMSPIAREQEEKAAAEKRWRETQDAPGSRDLSLQERLHQLNERYAIQNRRLVAILAGGAEPKNDVHDISDDRPKMPGLFDQVQWLAENLAKAESTINELEMRELRIGRL